MPKQTSGEVFPSSVKLHNLTVISGPSLTEKVKQIKTNETKAKQTKTQQHTTASSKEEGPDPFVRELNNDVFCKFKPFKVFLVSEIFLKTQ